MINIFTRNKKKDTSNSNSTTYSGYVIGGGGGESSSSSGLNGVTLTGDVITNRRYLNNNQLTIDTRIGNERVSWQTCDADLKSRINNGGGGGGGTTELAYIRLTATATDIEHIIGDYNQLPILEDHEDLYYLHYQYFDANESIFEFYNGRGDCYKLYADINDPTGTWTRYNGFTVNRINDYGWNLNAGTNITIVPNAANNSFTINSTASGGGGTTYVYWMNGTEDEQTLESIIAQSKIPILRTNDKDYVYSFTEVFSGNVCYYLISGDRDYYLVDRDGCNYMGNIDYPEFKYSTGGTTYKYLLNACRPHWGDSNYGGAKFNHGELNVNKISTSNLEDQLSQSNLPKDFINGLKSGRYKGITIGQDHTYGSTGNSPVYIPMGIYNFIGSWTQTINWTENGSSYSVNAYVINLRNEAYDFGASSNIHYDIYLWICNSSTGNGITLDDGDFNLIVYNSLN